MKHSIDLRRLEAQIREYQPKWRKCKSRLRFKLKHQLVYMKPVVSLRRLAVRSNKPIDMTADMTMGVGPQRSSLVENTVRKNKSKGRTHCDSDDTCKTDDSDCESAQADKLPLNTSIDNENCDKAANRVALPSDVTPPDNGRSRRKSYADTSPSVTFSPFRIMHRRKSCMDVSAVERTSHVATDKTDKRNRRKIYLESENHFQETFPPGKDKPAIISNANCTAGSSVELSPRKLRRKSCADVSPQVSCSKKDEHLTIERTDLHTEKNPSSKSNKKKRSTKKKEVHFGGEKVAADERSQNRKTCAKEAASTSKNCAKTKNEPSSQKEHSNRNDPEAPVETTKNQQAIVTRNRCKSWAEFEPDKANAKVILLDDSPSFSGNLLAAQTAPTCSKKRSHKKKQVEIDRHTGKGVTLEVSDTVKKESAEPEKKVHHCIGDTKRIVTIDLCRSSDEDDVLYVPGMPDKKPQLNKKRDTKVKLEVAEPDLKESDKPPTKSSRARPSNRSKADREVLKAKATKEVTSKADPNKLLTNGKGTIADQPSNEPPKRKRGRPFGSTNKSKKHPLSYVSSIMESSDTDPGVESQGATPLHEPPIKLVLRRTTKRPDLYQATTEVHRKRRSAKSRMGASGAVARAGADATQRRLDSRSSSIPMELEPRIDYVFYSQPNGSIRGTYALDKGVAPECTTPSTISSSTGHVTSTTPFFGAAKNAEGYLPPPEARGGGQYVPAATEWNNISTQPLVANGYEINNVQDIMNYLDDNGELDASGNVITIENYQSELVTQQSMNAGQNSIQWIASSTVTQCTETYLGQPSTHNSVPSYGQPTAHSQPAYAASTENMIQRPHMATSSNQTFAVPMAHHQRGYPYAASAPIPPPPMSYHNLIEGGSGRDASFSNQCEPLDLSQKSEFIREPTRPAATLTSGYTGYQQYHHHQQQQSNIPQSVYANSCNSMWQTLALNTFRKPAESVVSDDEDCVSTSSKDSSSSSNSSGTSDSESSSSGSSSSSSSASSSLHSSRIRSEIPPVALSLNSEDESVENAPKATWDKVQTRPGEAEKFVELGEGEEFVELAEAEEFVEIERANDLEGTVLKSGEFHIISDERLNTETAETHVVREVEHRTGEPSAPSNSSGGIKKISFNEFMMRSTQKMLQKRLEEQAQGPADRDREEEEFIAERVSPIKDVEAICQPVSHQETLSSLDDRRSKTPEAEHSSFGEYNDSQLDYEEFQDNEDTSEPIGQKTPDAAESRQVNEEHSNTGLEVSLLDGSSGRKEVKSEFKTKLADEPLRIIDITDELEDDQISLETSCFSSPETSPTKEKRQTVPPRVVVTGLQLPRVEEPTTTSLTKCEQKPFEAPKSPLVQTIETIWNPRPRNAFRKLQLPNSKKPAQPLLQAVGNARPTGQQERSPVRQMPTTSAGDATRPHHNDKLLHMYGLQCWPFLVDDCTELCPLSHNFCEPAEFCSKLEALSEDDLRSAYIFMYAHERLFRRYFAVFCKLYEQHHDRDMLLMMLSDALRYPDSGSFIYRINSGLLGCGLNQVNACRHVLAICGRVTQPRIINTLVGIIMQTDWTMFSEFLLRFAANQPLYRFPFNTLITMAKSWYQRQDRQMAAVIFSCMLTLSAEDAMRVRESPLLTRIAEVVST